jgi:hypothetical protein
MAKTKWQTAEAFFREQSGCSNEKHVHRLAKAEAEASKRGWHTHWEIDPDADNEPTDTYFVSGAPQWQALLIDEDGQCIASLGGIDLGYDDTGDEITPESNPPYRRVVEAELALEALIDAME